MSVNYSKMDLLGYTGNDPEPVPTANESQGARFSVAINRIWTGGSGKQQTETDWFEVMAWGTLAENCLAYLTKGRLVYVTGRPQLRQWESEDGQKRERLQIRADQVIFLDRPQQEETTAS
jgi:single-strand DNA-binding protein